MNSDFAIKYITTLPCSKCKGQILSYKGRACCKGCISLEENIKCPKKHEEDENKSQQPPKTKKAVILSMYDEGKSQKEIAEKTGFDAGLISRYIYLDRVYGKEEKVKL